MTHYFLYAIGCLFLGAGAWLVWVPWSEVRHAAVTGRPRLPFSRMLLRLVVAGCVLMLGLMSLLYPVLIPGRSGWFELGYLLAALFFAFVMFVAGFTDYLFVQRDLLLHRKAMIGEFVRPKAPRGEERGSEGKPGRNGG
jgi:hypothetical protein